MERAIFWSIAGLLLLAAAFIYLPHEINQDIELGGKSYSRSKISQSFKPLKVWTHQIDGHAEKVQYFLMASPKLNKCDSAEFRMTWQWSGMSNEVWSHKNVGFEMNKLEKGFYNTLSFLGGQKIDAIRTFKEIGHFATPLGDQNENVRTAELKDFFAAHGIPFSKNEKRILLLAGDRIIATIQRNPEGPAESIEYAPLDDEFLVSFSQQKKQRDEETVICLLKTAKAVSEELHDASI